MDRISMKEWKPELVYNKLQRLEHTMSEISEQMVPLKNEKMEIEGELNSVNAVLKSSFLPKDEFATLNARRSQLVKRKVDVELKMRELKAKLQKISHEKESAKIDLKHKPNELVKESIIELRDKYLSFSSDSTRVSSMRSMSSKFVEELQSLLLIIP